MCTFYTVRWLEATISETDKFIIKFKDHQQHKEALQHLAKFLDLIGNEKGALKSFFRFENTAHALPPSGSYAIGELTINYIDFPLRLYCLWLSTELVILFNGDEKTSANAQEGKTSMVFAEANYFAKRILKALQDKDILVQNSRTIVSYNINDEIIL
jgi:hypothetical protein